jgi:hypothetical protein
MVPPGQHPFEEEKESISKKVFDENIGAAMEKWGEKLRETADVKIYLSSPTAAMEKTEKK